MVVVVVLHMVGIKALVKDHFVRHPQTQNSRRSLNTLSLSFLSPSLTYLLEAQLSKHEFFCTHPCCQQWLGLNFHPRTMGLKTDFCIKGFSSLRFAYSLERIPKWTGRMCILHIFHISGNACSQEGINKSHQVFSRSVQSEYALCGFWMDCDGRNFIKSFLQLNFFVSQCFTAKRSALIELRCMVPFVILIWDFQTKKHY